LEQRLHPRIPLEVEVELESEHNFYTGLSQDLSEGGLFVATLDPPPIGEEVGFQLMLDGNSYLFYGVVIWIRSESASSFGAPAGCGIKWLTLEDGALDAIRSFVAKRDTDFYEE
jgi:uncharacterized protein (TIGR02266 family)